MLGWLLVTGFLPRAGLSDISAQSVFGDVGALHQKADFPNLAPTGEARGTEMLLHPAEVPGAISYPLGDPIHVTTPGVPFYGVSVQPGFACILPGNWWVDCYNSPRKYGYHKGWDYVIDSQSTWEVRSSMAGVVTFASYVYPYGNLVVVENEGFQTFFGHFASFAVSVGDLVQPGQLLGLAGSTGLSSSPHVHFEVRYCTPDGYCNVVDPRGVTLPGQVEPCFWDMKVTQTVTNQGSTYSCGDGLPKPVPANR